MGCVRPALRTRARPIRALSASATWTSLGSRPLAWATLSSTPNQPPLILDSLYPPWPGTDGRDQRIKIAIVVAQGLGSRRAMGAAMCQSNPRQTNVLPHLFTPV